MRISDELLHRLQDFRQEHLLAFWEELSEAQQAALARQLSSIDFERVQSLIEQRNSQSGETDGEQIVARATAPQQLIRLPSSQQERDAAEQAALRGEQLLKTGVVGAILVAGGQGTRLGFDHPKGMFPIGPVTDRTLFQLFCEQILARSQRAGTPIPYFIMTSEATHFATVTFFERHGYFGLNEDDVFFFQQGSLPAVEDGSQRILLESPGRVATSPDGHGGMFRALEQSGLLDVMRDRGIEHLYYHQVDNPTAILCDPVLLGYHLESGSEMTTKVVAKTSPEEKMGVLATVDGQTRIIEYSDLPEEQARRTQDNGALVFWAGNTAIHVLQRTFMERVLSDDLSLPFHIAHKRVACLNDQGELITPEQPNASKFEQFIFDALPLASAALVVEADRAREFNPVKNAEGADSPETSRSALAALGREWVRAAGGSVPDNAAIEVSPLFALDADELKARLPAGLRLGQDEVLSP